jgi:hypothetical protein
VERIASQQPIYPADRYFQYSNLGLTLAGEVVAARAGKPYDQYVRENILGPLQLANTYPEMPVEEKGKRLAQGYSAKRRDGTRAVLPLFQTRGIAPAAGFASTATISRASPCGSSVRAMRPAIPCSIRARSVRCTARHWVDPDFKIYRGIGFGTWKDGDNQFVGHGGAVPVTA